MFSFLKKNPKEELTFCVCVVNSYAVTGAVVRVFQREGSVTNPVVLFSYEEAIPLYHHRGAEVLEKMVFAHTKNVLEKCRSFHGNFDKIVCTIGEPWATTFSRSVHLEKKDPFKVTQKLIDEMVARDAKLFEQETVRDYRALEEVGIIGTSKPAVDINGYRIDFTDSVMAQNLDVHNSFSIAPAKFVEELLAVFGDVFHRLDVMCESMDTARSYLFSKNTRENISATILDIGGITSTLSIIDRGHVTYSASVPTGLSDVEGNLGILFDIARVQIPGTMKFATDEKFMEHHRDVYYKRIESAYRDFGVTLRRGITALKRHTQTVPEPVCVISNPTWVTTMQELLQSDIGHPIAIPHPDALEDLVIYSNTAYAKNIPLSLAILQAVKNIT